MNAMTGVAAVAAGRLAAGGFVDRAAPLSFHFDGRTYPGLAGDTLASALLANGVRLVGRSFKLHRPRGVLAAGAEEPNALVELRSGARREPNTRATQVELYDGLEAASQNRWPSLAFDLMAVNGLAAPLLKAGFYYKTFMWPAAFWERVYEPLIRRAAGLGRASGLPDPDHYEKTHAHCDVLVIGSGPAGLMAALTAARAGARVILAEQDFRMGGRLLEERRTLDGRPAADWAAATLAELAGLPDVTLLPRTTVFGTYDQRVFGAVERVADHLPEPPPHTPRQRLWRIVARRTVLAAGAIERPVAFGCNDLPGVMLAGAVRAYVNRYAVLPGVRVVVFASCDDAAATVRDLAAAGATVAAVVDPRPESTVAMAQAAAAAGALLLAGAAILRAHGRRAVEAVTIAGPKGEQRVPCDLVAMSAGWSPTLHLTSHTGCKPVWNAQIAAFVPDALPKGMGVAGAANGGFTLAAALEQGAAAAVAALAAEGVRADRPPLPETEPEPSAVAPLWRVKAARGPAFLDFQNDVTTDDVSVARAEGFRAAELFKRYTTLGMATDQGKTSGVSGVAVMAELDGAEIPSVGVTTFRPPFTAVALGALGAESSGRDYRPTRLPPTHAWAEARGAVFTEAGLWLRAQYFPGTPAEDWLTAATREALAVRGAVGLCDVSTLGKIDVQGPDAAAFLDFVYANTMSTVAVGKARYGLMLREDGFLLDDGTAARLSPTHYVVTTTTANAAKVMQHLDHARQVLRPDLDVRISSATDQWAQIAVAGPRARDLLARVMEDPGCVSPAALPYMGVGRGRVGGVAARLFRLSFSGELGFEIAAPARYGAALIERLMEAGADLGALPYGTEALSMLRIEKGHAAGGELNGQTTAHDLGLGRMLSTKKDFIGRRMAARPALTDPARPTLVGLRALDPKARFSGGAHVLPMGAPRRIAHDLGHVTSACVSPVLGRAIGLALVSGGPARLGEHVVAHDPVRDRDTPCEIVSPVFIDPDGGRLRA